MDITYGLPHAPYFIFLKGLTDKTDTEILELFDLGDHIETAIRNDLSDEHCIYMSRDDSWVHLMDNYFYTHWHSKKFSMKVEELGKTYELFSCSAGDCDLSFDFKYYKNGVKIREYIVESPNYDNEILKVNFGEPLLGEREALQRVDHLERVIHIASSLGIELPTELKQIKCYEINTQWYQL